MDEGLAKTLIFVGILLGFLAGRKWQKDKK